MSGHDRDAARLALHRTFRPRAARVVCWVLAVLTVATMTTIALMLPTVAAGRDSWGDRAGIIGFGLLIAWFLLRQAGVRAVPDETGLTVRNLVVTRRVEWTQIVLVRFGQGRPWVQLDLDDGDTLAVMGIQAADGARATAEARRLSTLVALHSATPTND